MLENCSHAQHSPAINGHQPTQAPTGIRPTRYAGPLLGWAKAVVPRRRRASTPVFLYATAGLRKLAEGQQEDLMHSVRSVLRTSPFRSAAPRRLAHQGPFFLLPRLQAALVVHACRPIWPALASDKCAILPHHFQPLRSSLSFTWLLFTRHAFACMQV
jgi:hypothetical protein